MRILHIITGLNYGGAEKLLLDLCKEQIKKNDIYVIYLKTDGKMKEKFITENINVIKIPLKRFNVLSVILKICIFIKKHNINVVHTHCAHANFIGRTSAILCSVDCIVTTIHNTDRWVSKQGLKYDALRFYERFLINRSNSYAIAISDAVKEYIVNNEKISADKIIVIKNAVNAKNIIDISNEKIDKKYKISNYDFVICNVGRLVEQKGQIYLLKALKYLINDKKISNIKCFIVGDGDQKSNFEEYIIDNNLEKNVYLTGLQQNPYKYIKASNIFVMPSLWEGFGIVILEAFALKVPVLTTNVDGLKELVIDKYNGKCISSGDYKLLAEEILKFYNNYYDIHKFVENSSTILCNFTIQKYYINVSNMYKSVLCRKENRI